MTKPRVPKILTVNDRMQRGYVYELTELPGKNFDPAFLPHYTPQEMLCMGVFEGKYINDCHNEFPADWFANAKLSDTPNPVLNCFKIKSRQPLSVWREKGWIIGPDPRGWFQWYCRYYMGRRLHDVDKRQIQRWQNFARHAAQVRKNCEPGNPYCRPRQRQALLQWAHDAFV